MFGFESKGGGDPRFGRGIIGRGRFGGDYREREALGAAAGDRDGLGKELEEWG